jgi:ASCH domain
MKCLSLKQPFATLVITGRKRVETRSWPTTHRGPLAIQATRQLDAEARSLCEREPFRTVLESVGYRRIDRLPLGALLGTVEVTGCRPTEEVDVDPASDEAAFGDFRPGRWGWLFAEPTRLLKPLPCKGQLGLFDLPVRFRRGCYGLMAEEQWTTEGDPERLFEVVGDRASARKLRLFAVACCRRVRSLLTEDGCRCVDLAEERAEVAVEAAVEGPPAWTAEINPYGELELALLSPDAYLAATYASDEVLEVLERYCNVRRMALPEIHACLWRERNAQADLFRDIVGTPFRTPSPVAPFVLAWNDDTVRRIAEGIYGDRAFDRLPILADALLDAGCDDDELIGHCRSTTEHVPGCWAVDLVLGKR